MLNNCWPLEVDNIFGGIYTQSFNEKENLHVDNGLVIHMTSENYEEMSFGHDLDLLVNHLALLQIPYAMRSGCRVKSVALRPAYPSLFQSRGTYSC